MQKKCVWSDNDVNAEQYVLCVKQATTVWSLDKLKFSVIPNIVVEESCPFTNTSELLKLLP